MSEQTNDNAMPQGDLPIPQPAQAQVNDVMELLRTGKSPRERAEPSATEQDPADKPTGKRPLKTLQDAAERLGVKIEDLYKLEFGLGGAEENAERPTLGKLKDHFAERESHSLENLRWGEERAKAEGELMRSRNELTELMAMLPPEAIKPEVLNKVREKHVATVARERELTLSVIPEWQTESVRDADLVGMREHLTNAGFPKGYLERVTDHKTMRYIRENYMREQRINAALALVKTKQKETPAPSQRGKQGARAPSEPSKLIKGGMVGESQKVDAIRSLLFNREK
jgi:hypothetical protein